MKREEAELAEQRKKMKHSIHASFKRGAKKKKKKKTVEDEDGVDGEVEEVRKTEDSKQHEKKAKNDNNKDIAKNDGKEKRKSQGKIGKNAVKDAEDKPIVIVDDQKKEKRRSKNTIDAYTTKVDREDSKTKKIVENVNVSEDDAEPSATKSRRKSSRRSAAPIITEESVEDVVIAVSTEEDEEETKVENPKKNNKQTKHKTKRKSKTGIQSYLQSAISSVVKAGEEKETVAESDEVKLKEKCEEVTEVSLTSPSDMKQGSDKENVQEEENIPKGPSKKRKMQQDTATQVSKKAKTSAVDEVPTLSVKEQNKSSRQTRGKVITNNKLDEMEQDQPVDTDGENVGKNSAIVEQNGVKVSEETEKVPEEENTPSLRRSSRSRKPVLAYNPFEVDCDASFDGDVPQLEKKETNKKKKKKKKVEDEDESFAEDEKEEDEEEEEVMIINEVPYLEHFNQVFYGVFSLRRFLRFLEENERNCKSKQDFIGNNILKLVRFVTRSKRKCIINDQLNLKVKVKIPYFISSLR